MDRGGNIFSVDNSDNKSVSSKSVWSKSEYSGKKRKLSTDSDAALIAAETEETLKMLNLDPNSKDGKKKKRQIRNRMSAQFHRDRKNAFIDQLQLSVTQKNQEILLLKEKIQSLETEIMLLKGGNLVNDGLIPHAVHDSENGSTTGNSHHSDSDETDTITAFDREAGYISSYAVSPVHPSALEAITADKNNQLNALKPKAETLTYRNTGNGLFPSSGFAHSLTVISMLCMVGIMMLGTGGDSVASLSTGIPSFNGEKSDSIITKIQQHLSSMNANSGSMEEEIRAVVGRRLEALSINEDVKEKIKEPVVDVSVPSSKLSNTTKSSIPDAFNIQGFLNGMVNGSAAAGHKYLRSTPVHPLNVTKQTDSKAESITKPLFISKDLIPSFDNSRFGATDKYVHWSENSFDYSVQSFSSVVMNQGKALFDPDITFKKKFLYLQEREFNGPNVIHQSDSIITRNRDAFSDSSNKIAKSLPTMLPLIESTPFVKTSADARSSPVSTIARIRPIVSTTDHSISEKSTTSTDLIIKKLDYNSRGKVNDHPVAEGVTNSNIMKIQLPLSSIRVGKSWDQSASSSLDDIVNLFKSAPHFSSNETDDQNYSVKFDSTSTTSVELNCIIIGAKLVHTAIPSNSD